MQLAPPEQMPKLMSTLIGALGEPDEWIDMLPPCPAICGQGVMRQVVLPERPLHVVGSPEDVGEGVPFPVPTLGVGVTAVVGAGTGVWEVGTGPDP